VCQRPAVSGEPFLAELAEPVTASLASPADAESHEIVGVWRDGDALVIDRHNHQFPARCVKTNAPVPLPLDTRNLKYLPNRVGWSLVGGSLGRMVGRAVSGETVSIRMGLSGEWKRRDKLQKSIGWGLFVVGWLGLVLAVVAEDILRAAFAGSGAADVLPSLIAVAAFGAAMIGMVVLAIRYGRALRVSSIRGQFVWLRGVSDRFLARLPAWQGR
jgi:hypothetical protein